MTNDPNTIPDIDLAFGVDDEMQGDIDKMKADPLELEPNKDGFTPKELVPEAPEGSPEYAAGYREKHVQEARCEIESAGMRAIGDDGTQIVFVQYRVMAGKNKEKRLEQSWWLHPGNKDEVRDMNAGLQDLFGKLKLTPKVVKAPDGREVTSYIGSLGLLNKRQVKVRVQQKWDYPYAKDSRGEWHADADSPKKFKKRILRVVAA